MGDMSLNRSGRPQGHLLIRGNFRDWPVTLSLRGLVSVTGRDARSLCVENEIFLYFVLYLHGVQVRPVYRMNHKEISLKQIITSTVWPVTSM